MKLESSMKIINDSNISFEKKVMIINELKQLEKYRERVRKQVARSRANKKARESEGE